MMKLAAALLAPATMGAALLIGPLRGPAIAGPEPAQVQPTVVVGSGSVILAPGGSVQFVSSPPSPAPGGPRPPVPFSSATVTNRSSEQATVSTGQHGLDIALPAGSAILLDDPSASRTCQYGSALVSPPTSEPANTMVCLWGATISPTIDFTSEDWPSPHLLTIKVTYAAGWNLIGIPSLTSSGGLDASGVEQLPDGGLLAWQGALGEYQPLSPPDGIQSGSGYWAYYDQLVTVSLAAAGPRGASVALPAGQYVAVGNPGEASVALQGADVAYVYDPSAGGYQPVTILQPGQGAWAYSAAGGTLTLVPVGS